MTWQGMLALLVLGTPAAKQELHSFPEEGRGMSWYGTISQEYTFVRVFLARLACLHPGTVQAGHDTHFPLGSLSENIF
jgi:hypothetical protein